MTGKHYAKRGGTADEVRSLIAQFQERNDGRVPQIHLGPPDETGQRRLVDYLDDIAMVCVDSSERDFIQTLETNGWSAQW